MGIEGYKRTPYHCLKHINFKDAGNRFEANITVLRYYFSEDSVDSTLGCPNIVRIKTTGSNGNVLLKITVSSLDNKKNGDKKIKFTTITLQKI